MGNWTGYFFIQSKGYPLHINNGLCTQQESMALGRARISRMKSASSKQGIMDQRTMFHEAVRLSWDMRKHPPSVANRLNRISVSPKPTSCLQNNLCQLSVTMLRLVPMGNTSKLG